MNGSEIAALIVAVTGALAAVFAGVRNLKGDRVKREVEAAAAVLTGYTNLAASLQTELDRLKNDCIEDRKQWAAERTSMRAEHKQEMDELREEHKQEMLTAYERIDELGTQVYVLQNRPLGSHDRKGDR